MEELTKAPQDNEKLPLTEYVEFLRDLRDILNNHKEYLFTKINTWYLTHPDNRRVHLAKSDTFEA